MNVVDGNGARIPAIGLGAAGIAVSGRISASVQGAHADFFATH
jgi:hypothetical protein